MFSKFFFNQTRSRIINLKSIFKSVCELVPKPHYEPFLKAVLGSVIGTGL